MKSRINIGQRGKTSILMVMLYRYILQSTDVVIDPSLLTSLYICNASALEAWSSVDSRECEIVFGKNAPEAFYGGSLMDVKRRILDKWSCYMLLGMAFHVPNDNGTCHFFLYTDGYYISRPTNPWIVSVTLEFYGVSCCWIWGFRFMMFGVVLFHVSHMVPPNHLCSVFLIVASSWWRF